MGMAGTSYEAQQAPLYYALLAIPNLTLKKLQIDPDLQIRVLRAFGIFSLLCSAWLFIAIFGILHSLTGIPKSYGLLCAICALHLYISDHATLGNDCFSLFICCSTVLASLLFLREKRRYWLFLSAVSSLAASYVKIINAPIIFIPTLAYIFQRYSGLDANRSNRTALALSPILFVPSWNLVQFLKFRSLLPGIQVANNFSAIVQPVPSISAFANFLLRDAFGATELATRHCLGLVIAAFALNLCCSLWTLVRKNSLGAASLVSAFVVLSTLSMALLLNKYVVGVQWLFFRHYMGFAPFWLTALLVFPIRSTRLTEALLFSSSVLAGCIFLFLSSG